MLQKIFSIKNEYSGGGKRKIVTMCGIKLKIYIKPKTCNIAKKDVLTAIIPTMLKNKFCLEGLIANLTQDYSIKEIIVINNSEESYDYNNPKVRVINNGTNIFVNPAWNLGVKESKTDFVVLLNDDLVLPKKFCQSILRHIPINLGVIGMDSNTILNLGPNVTKESPRLHPIKLKPINNLSYNFGTIMFFDKNNFVPIPDELKIYYGDNWLIASMIEKCKNCYKVVGPKILHYGSMTSKDYTELMKKEEKEFLKYYSI